MGSEESLYSIILASCSLLSLTLQIIYSYIIGLIGTPSNIVTYILFILSFVSFFLLVSHYVKKGYEEKGQKLLAKIMPIPSGIIVGLAIGLIGLILGALKVTLFSGNLTNIVIALIIFGAEITVIRSTIIVVKKLIQRLKTIK